jgi:protein-disulfide isomerase
VKSGEVRFAYIHFAFLGPESKSAAEASECAAEQDAFWEYHDNLYANQNGENRGAFNDGNLKRFASDLGLDTAQFNQCLDSGKYADIVQQEIQMAQQIGVSSTPTFVINGRPVLGAQPFEVFQQYIQTALSESK